MKYFICEHCGNLIELVNDKKVPVMCCGQKMTELVPNTKEAAVEKHKPVYERIENLLKVNVSTVAHPMIDVHYIEFIAVKTNKGVYRKALLPNDLPYAEFLLDAEEEVVDVFAYCNLHGLWSSK